MKAAVFFLVFISLPFSQNLSLEEVRKLYVRGAESESVAEKLLEDLRKQGSLTPVLLAYKGATQALMAKYATLPNKKYSLAKKGMHIINSAVSKDPQNIEIRYLRFTIQHNVPSFLGLSGDIKSDKNIIIANISKRKQYQIDDAFLKEMANFLINSKECSEDEIQKIKQEANLE